MFEWFKNLFLPSSSPDITQSIIAILITTGIGVLAGRLKIRKVSLGVSAVMFVGILLGHYGYTINEDISTFIRDFGLILFVYAIGIMVGPSFFSSFRKEGIKFNLLAVSAVLLSGIITYIIYLATNIGIENSVGLMSGAVTNTPGLGAAKSTLNEIGLQFKDRKFADPAISYAITYPLGVLGVIAVIVATKMIFKINIKEEVELLAQTQNESTDSLSRKKCRITNPEIFGRSIYHILKDHKLTDLIISRLKHSGSTEVFSPSLDTRLSEKDVVMVVGNPIMVERFLSIAGKESSDLIIETEKDIISKTIYVTRKSATHKKLSELDLFNKYGLKVTRVYRSGLELLATPTLVLYYGDRIRLVGDRDDIDEVEKFIGNSEKRLLEPDFLSLFGGLVIGLIIGSIPIVIPSLPVPIKLGFAAGPLIAALLISRYGGIGVIHSYINNGAIYFMKDLGICLFFSSVGLHAGTHFYDNFMQNNGWVWLYYGAFITLIPLIYIVVVGRVFLKINFAKLVGLMSGSYTDPAALAFSNGYLDSEIPTQTYATVYPLVTIFRIFIAQMLILLCF
ncbi:MAG: putative transporter [Saprospiraceae bacterium]|jgi:putative transport protein|nr:putative transporter [Saprospiraceae bacterium]